MDVASDAIGWLGALLAVGGGVVSALHVRRTAWAGVLAGGFALQAVALGVTRVAIVLISRSDPSGGTIQAAFVLASLLGLMGSAAIVAGVAGVLAQLEGASQPAEAPAPGLPLDEGG